MDNRRLTKKTTKNTHIYIYIKKWTTGDVAEHCRYPFWASKQFLKSVLTQLFDVAEHKFERLWQRLTLDENVAMTETANLQFFFVRVLTTPDGLEPTGMAMPGYPQDVALVLPGKKIRFWGAGVETAVLRAQAATVYVIDSANISGIDFEDPDCFQGSLETASQPVLMSAALLTTGPPRELPGDGVPFPDAGDGVPEDTDDLVEADTTEPPELECKLEPAGVPEEVPAPGPSVPDLVVVSSSTRRPWTRGKAPPPKEGVVPWAVSRSSGQMAFADSLKAAAAESSNPKRVRMTPAPPDEPPPSSCLFESDKLFNV